MSEIIIANLMDPRCAGHSIIAQIENIFFETSTKKDFKDQKERDQFKWKYLGYYLSHYPQYAWIAVKEEQVLGYLIGMPFTQDHSLYQLQPHLKAFESHFQAYPAHLHINCHPLAQGQGVGRGLVSKFIQQLKFEKVPGLHIMTGPASDNRKFYQKLGFDFEVTANSILLMGIRI